VVAAQAAGQPVISVDTKKKGKRPLTTAAFVDCGGSREG